jgi:T-complex protein 1 subunit beta
MDKILQSMSEKGEINITNDGATILKSLHVANPAAKILIDMSKVQDEECGDGTTSVVVLAGELLREAEMLMNQRLHPMTIIDGWRLACDVARDALRNSATNHSNIPEAFKNDLIRIAKTTLSSKLLNKDKDKFAKLAVDAVLRLKGKQNLELIQVIKIEGGSLEQSYLDKGFLLQKKFGVGQPKRIEKARIMVANTAMDTDKIKIYGSRVKVDDLEQVAAIEEEEKQKMARKVEKIKSSGINVFVNRQLIYNYPEELFAKAGIAAIEHADFEGVERLSAVTGAEVASTFDSTAVLGYAELVEEVMIGEERLIRFSGVKAGEACSIVLRGASSHVLDEAERSLHDALAVLSSTMAEPRVTRGAGCAEMLMAKAIDDLVPTVVGKKSLAVASFAKALRSVVAVIADNGGYDSAELIALLRNEHHLGHHTMGLDMVNGTVAETDEILESFKLKEHVLMAAAEAAELIVRVDDIIATEPRRRNEQ